LPNVSAQARLDGKSTGVLADIAGAQADPGSANGKNVQSSLLKKGFA
jgi:hypothetical protein